MTLREEIQFTLAMAKEGKRVEMPTETVIALCERWLAVEGWKLVPTEATEGMLDALQSSEYYCESCKGYAFDARNGYERMLAAAPDQP